jgi:hypothetical protein
VAIGKSCCEDNEKPDASSASGFFEEATAGFEPAIRVLQTHALPLGYVAVERAMRLELTTFSLARRRSTTELRPQNRE